MVLLDAIRRGEYVALADIEMEYETLGEAIRALDATIAAQAKALKNAPDWVAVTSGDLPPPDENVCQVRMYHDRPEDGVYLSADKIRDAHSAQQQRITHWLRGLRLPPLPQEESDGNAE